jgi:hypothetical protein
MEQAKVIICDICKERVSNVKCAICERDLCRNCNKLISWQVFNWESKIIELRVCKECKERMEEIVQKDYKDEKDILDKMTKLFISLIKDKSIFNELDKHNQEVTK